MNKRVKNSWTSIFLIVIIIMTIVYSMDSDTIFYLCAGAFRIVIAYIIYRMITHFE